MKKLSAMLAMAAICVAFAGCGRLQERKSEIHAAIIEVVETKGQEAAVAYVDKLVAEGKLGTKNAEKIKAAIPQGIEKLKATMGEQNDEQE